MDGSLRDSATARRRPTTIYDIARAASVSPSTVSRALSQPGRLAAQTEQRIRLVAESLDYRVNTIARALHAGKTFTLALVVADITNPVVFSIVRGAESAAAARGYTLIVAESQESGEREAEALARLAPSVDGVILGMTRMPNHVIRELSATKRTAVINRVIDGVTCIVPRPEPGVGDALASLAELGHRSVAYLPGPRGSFMTSRRRQALVVAAERNGMTIDVLRPTMPTVEGGRAAWESVQQHPATAVFAYNDLVAIGLLLEAQRRGVDLPRAKSIVGFDDIFGADFTSPSLSTVRAPLEEAGRRAVGAMFADYDDGLDPLATTFVRRGSVAPPAQDHLPLAAQQKDKK